MKWLKIICKFITQPLGGETAMKKDILHGGGEKKMFFYINSYNTISPELFSRFSLFSQILLLFGRVFHGFLERFFLLYRLFHSRLLVLLWRLEFCLVWYFWHPCGACACRKCHLRHALDTTLWLVALSKEIINHR